MNITTANRLVQYRKARGMSQEELAGALGISRQAISKWERAEASPDTDNLIALAKLYGVSLDHLLLEEGEPEPAPIPQSQPQAAPTVLLLEEASAAPNPPQWEVTPTSQSLYAEPNLEDSDGDNEEPSTRKPLSREARRLLNLLGLLVGVVFFFSYGILRWIFPPLADAYPIMCALIYLLIGFLGHRWHPTWLIFMTIPLFDMLFGI